MTESIGNNFILNGDLLSSELFQNSLVYEGESIYEVIRMVRGLPVFFNDHVDRLDSSVRLKMKRMLADEELLRSNIIALSRAEKRKEANLKIVFNFNGARENYLLYFIEPIYPTAEQYRTGVNGILYKAERMNPDSKLINHKLRSTIYHRLIIEGAYEALLVDRHNCITEGSRSNIFFIKENHLYTAPEKYILSGITRKHILSICEESKIEVTLTCVNADSVSEYDTVFMSGTSPIILPFSNIDSFRFNTNHEYLPFLRNQYLTRAEDSMRCFSGS